jgi:cell division septum initiation protein DivIVA
MTVEGPGRAGAPSLTSLPRFEDIPQSGDGLDAERVREAFDAFRRHASQLQAQLRVLQAAGRTSTVEPSGHAVRMDALHLIRAAAEFADTIERDAQTASATQLSRTEEEVRRKQTDLQERESEVERYRQESERQRAEMLNAARNEARELLARSNADATRELQEAEARGSRMLEQARHQATELTNAARAEVEQTLEWARAQGGAILARAQHGAEQLLAAAGLGEAAISHVANAIVEAAERSVEGSRAHPPAAAVAGPAAVSAPEPEPEPEPEAEPEHERGPSKIPPPPTSSAPPPPPVSVPPPATDVGTSSEPAADNPAAGDGESASPES